MSRIRPYLEDDGSPRVPARTHDKSEKDDASTVRPLMKSAPTPIRTRRDDYVINALERMAASQRGDDAWNYAVDDLLRTPGDDRYPSFKVLMQLVACNMLPSVGDADEAVQQGSVSFYTSAKNGSFKPTESLNAKSPAASVATYLKQAVRSRCLDMLDKQERDRDGMDKLPDIPAVGSVDESAIAVRIAVAKLPASLRDVVHLRLQGFTFAIIGAKLGIHRKTARERWERAIKLLGGMLGDDPSGGEPVAA